MMFYEGKLPADFKRRNPELDGSPGGQLARVRHRPAFWVRGEGRQASLYPGMGPDRGGGVLVGFKMSATIGDGKPLKDRREIFLRGGSPRLLGSESFFCFHRGNGTNLALRPVSSRVGASPRLSDEASRTTQRGLAPERSGVACPPSNARLRPETGTGGSACAPGASPRSGLASVNGTDSYRDDPGCSSALMHAGLVGDCASIG